MCGYVDEMAVARKLPDDDDVISYILNSLDADYNSLIEQVNGMVEVISPEELYSCLLDTKARLVAQKAQREQKEQYHMLANAIARGSNNNSKQQHHGSF
jgi:RNA processing factor Prp31